MVTEVRPQPSLSWEGGKPLKARVTLFHCFNALSRIPVIEDENYEIQSIKMPCSSLIREVFLLRAFEAGADAVLVLACPEGSCRYLQGNTRAQKRVERVQKILNEIGLEGRRLQIYKLPRDGPFEVSRAIRQTLSSPDIRVPEKVA